ncbi:hypothetical protein [uncultured Mailhella sp.]|uniref:hypothetical protein n=1 Tax=uncultured Mailhella sp. TaxID=1981031 RepID=UPI002613906F|nr:hypothetical protein [uncultured Mailhella sp.]
MKAADSWSDFFRKAIQETAKERSKQGLRGVVMCGPLIPQKRPGWFDSQSCAGRMQISRKPAPDTIWLPERTAADIVAEGAKLYGERLRDHLPTYLDTLPELKILTFKENDLGWTNMVESTVCKGGQEYENVVEGFCYQKRHSHLDAWLQRENENTYRKETVPLPFVPLKDIPINMHIRMKPASGLALVRLETLDHSIEDLLFDFSRMQEVTEPDFSRMLEASEPEKGELFCPKDEHIVLSEDIQSVDRNEFIWDCQRFVSAPKNITSLSYYETLRTKRLLPSCQPKFIDEKGNTQPEFEELMKTVRKQLVVCVGNLDNANLPNIIKKASFLWGKTPESFKKFLVDTLSRGLSDLQHTSQQGSLLANSVPPVSNTLPYAKNYAIGHRDVVEAAGRCFHKKEECRLLFQYIVRLNLNRAFAMEAAFNVLHYRPEAWQALDDKTAYGLLKIAIDMMEAQHTSKKVMFRNAASLIFVLLKYRLQDNHRDFLNDHDTTAKEFEVRQKLQKYIGEIEKSLNDQKDQKIKMAGRTRKNLENSLKYLKEIFDYIDFKGNPNAVPVWNNNPVKMGKKQRNN